MLDLLEKLVAAAPERVFDLVATALLKGGQTHGYAYESLAADQFTRLIGRFLADQKGIFATDERRALLIACIDSFIQAGWPSARRLLNDLPDLLR